MRLPVHVLVMRCLVVIPTSLATACGGGACGTGQQSASQTPPAVVATSAAIPGNVSTPEDLKVVLQGVETLATRIPRETFDVKAVMQAVGNDPAAILNWVRENTSWVPYRGALRGPPGVLMDRVGNLVVRVAGYSDYFCDLTRPLQDEIITRTEHGAF